MKATKVPRESRPRMISRPPKRNTAIAAALNTEPGTGSRHQRGLLEIEHAGYETLIGRSEAGQLITRCVGAGDQTEAGQDIDEESADRRAALADL